MRWAEVLMATEIVVNWVVMLMIIGKLYFVGYRFEGPVRGRQFSAILALVESGALFSITMGAFIALWASGHVLSFTTHRGTC